MPLSRKQEEAAARLADEIEALDPDELDWQDAWPLRAIVQADAEVAKAKEHLVDAVATAHRLGLSWTAIGTVLGVSRQAARQRFGAKLPADVP
jgi:hypothetical protein